MFDVFYSGNKPNLFVHECEIESIEQAQQQSRTGYFWMVSYLVDYTGFDFLWKPAAWQSHQCHAWPSQHQKDSGIYLVPKSGYSEINYRKELVLTRLPDRSNWTIPENFAADSFDFSWHPDATEPDYVYQFGTQHQRTGGPVYAVPGATKIKYVQHPRSTRTTIDPYWTIPENFAADSFDFSWHPDATEPDYVYQFGTQHQRTGGPVYAVPGATKIKYVQHPRSTRTTIDPYWTVPNGTDTGSFDWTWHPDATEPDYVYQFGTQHQRTGGPVYAVPGATKIKYVEQIKIHVDSTSAVIVEIDHLDGNAKQIANTVKTIRYFDNYRDTLIRIAKSLVGQHEFVWICSSICDYTDFDFSWHPEQWQATMLHVFASNEQKFGDTFYMHVPSFAEHAEHRALLEWYDCNFVDTIVSRRRMPVIEHAGDSHVDAVKTTEWAGPVALFTTNGKPITIPAVNLWRNETKTITPLSSGASAVVVPKSAIPYIKTQLYDYPYIDKTQQQRHGDIKLDIVFISNGETNAKSNFLQMTMYLANESRHTNRVHLVEGVNGRAAAYHAAAEASTTPWFFAVFAKLEVNQMFDWSWQPDRMQQAKHYIFHAGNPVNGLVYGHQAMIAYNRQLVLDNPGVGLDFTLDSPHEVVPILSGTANYAESPWTAWRTAFRECIKLKASLPDVENEYRLKVWLKEDSGTIANGHWSHKGAQDAVEYYDQVNGDFDALKKSYEWEWLATYAFVKRSLLPSQ